MKPYHDLFVIHDKVGIRPTDWGDFWCVDLVGDPCMCRAVPTVLLLSHELGWDVAAYLTGEDQRLAIERDEELARSEAEHDREVELDRTLRRRP